MAAFHSAEVGTSRWQLIYHAIAKFDGLECRASLLSGILPRQFAAVIGHRERRKIASLSASELLGSNRMQWHRRIFALIGLAIQYQQ
jgi:hypothetical protein